MRGPYDDEPDGPEEEGLEEAELAGPVWVICPYCGERVETLVDPTGGASQEYVEDCEVCCRPWSVRVSVDPLGEAHVSVEPLDDE